MLVSDEERKESFKALAASTNIHVMDFFAGTGNGSSSLKNQYMAMTAFAGLWVRMCNPTERTNNTNGIGLTITFIFSLLLLHIFNPWLFQMLPPGLEFRAISTKIACEKDGTCIKLLSNLNQVWPHPTPTLQLRSIQHVCHLHGALTCPTPP